MGQDIAGFSITEDVPGLSALMRASDKLRIGHLSGILLPAGLHSQAGSIVIIYGIVIVRALMDLVGSCIYKVEQKYSDYESTAISYEFELLMRGKSQIQK
jgi:hypothetical protein